MTPETPRRSAWVDPAHNQGPARFSGNRLPQLASAPGSNWWAAASVSVRQHRQHPGRGDQLASCNRAMALRTLVAAHLPVPLGVGTPLAFSCSAMTP